VSAAKAKDKSKKTWDLTGPWAGAWKVFAGIGAVGLLGAGAGFFSDPRRFAFSWMFAYVTVLAVALGSIFFVLIQRLTSAGWSVTVRRTAEFFGIGIIALIPLFLPILASMGHLFPWLSGEHRGEHHSSVSIVTPAYAQEHGTDPHAAPPGHAGAERRNVPSDNPEPAAHGAATHRGHGPGGDPHALIHSTIMGKKVAYLNKGFFIVRVIFYFIIWALLATRLFGYSTGEDKKKDPNLTLAAQRFAPPGTFLFGITLTFAAFDFIMSLEPTWFSTIFGVTYFACGVVSSLAIIILTTLALRDAGPLQGAVTIEHYHDLGKLMFGFLVFWGYVNFSQFMLIWYAALPEETTFFHNRWDYAPWDKVSLAIIAFGFVLPFFWTMSRWFKRNTGRLQIGAAILVVMHVVNMYWHVMPNYALGREGFTFHWMDIACLLAVAGFYGAFVFHRMTQHPLIPVGDPRLERALNFQNA
jgi:hypothetical protein